MRADQLADRIALLAHGRLIAEGTPEELKRLVPGGHVVLRFIDLSGLEYAARLLDASARDNVAFTLQVPSDGTVRSGIGNNAILALGWCIAVTLVAFLWARKLYNRDPSR